MAMNSPASPAAVCLARAFKVRVFPGQEDAYERYLREAVEPIDAIAHEAGVFAHMVAMRPEGACVDWTHARVFFFTDAAQRERFTEAMARAAARFDGTAAAAERRLALAATLREKVGTSDYRVSG